MLPQQKAFSVLNITLMVGSAVIIALYFVLLYGQALGTGQLLGTSVATTAMAITHIGYMLFLHPFLKNRSLLASSFVGTLLFSLNVMLLLIATGNFGSPYYGLWLLMIILVGLYRPPVTLGFLAVSTLYFGATFFGTSDREALSEAVIPLIATYVAGGLSVLVWSSHHSKHSEKENLTVVSQQLSQEQLKSEILIHNIGDGVVVVDSSARIQLFNPAAEKLTGWNEAEAKGLDYHVVMPLGDDKDQPLTGDNDPFEVAARRQDAQLRDDVTLTTRSGKKLSLSFMASTIIGEDQKPQGGIAVFRDISQAREADRQRDEFISTASHEMRTPVAAIEGYVALALNPKVTTIDAKAKDYLTKAQEASAHLGKLFQDLLSTTKLEEGKLPSHPEVFEITNMVNAVVDELHFKAQKKNLNLQLQSVATHGGTTVQPLYYTSADPERIREVLTNLVDNALKFTQQGEVSISIEADAKLVTVGVHDTGMGISPEDLPHIFQKFYRIDNTKTRTIGGTGLGLYICRQIVELYSGRMWVESALDRGSHFYFSLPRVDSAKATTPLPSQNAGQTGSSTSALIAKVAGHTVK